jgi:hypothetical protein
MIYLIKKNAGDTIDSYKTRLVANKGTVLTMKITLVMLLR